MNKPLFYAKSNFLSDVDWDAALSILHAPGWHFGSWHNDSNTQWVKYLDDDEFFSKRFVECVNDEMQQFGLEVNVGYPKNIRANSTGYGVGGEEHADWLGEGKEEWYTILWYANQEYHPSWGGSFYYYPDDTSVKFVHPFPNQLVAFHGHVKHSWLPYMRYDGQRINVTLSLRPIK
jgi:hypothetical protein